MAHWRDSSFHLFNLNVKHPPAVILNVVGPQDPPVAVALSVCEPTDSVLVTVPFAPHVGVLVKYCVRVPAKEPSMLTEMFPPLGSDDQTAI